MRKKCGPVSFLPLAFFAGKLPFPLAIPLFSGMALLLGACGVEDYPYINPVPQSAIQQSLNNRAVVDLSYYDDTLSFNHFAVFYRIYVSDTVIPATTVDQFGAINSALSADYNAIRPYIDSDTFVNANMDSLFRGRGYKYLYVEGDDISSVLSKERSVAGNTLVFNFSSSPAESTMTTGGVAYTLMRSTGEGVFNPLPADRYFINREELWRSQNINANTNADVVNKNGISPTGPHHTYAALFIAAVGIDPTTYSYIYSTPALIHVFLLPE